jgi:hypothetical protein
VLLMRLAEEMKFVERGQLRVTSKGRVAQLSSIQKTTKDFVPEGLNDSSLAVYCLDTQEE